MAASNFAYSLGIPPEQFGRVCEFSFGKRGQERVELNWTQDREVALGRRTPPFSLGRFLGVAFFAQRAFRQAQ
jgi:hypothetical protein